MAGSSDFLDPKDLSLLAKHQVLAKRVVEGFCSGLHRSPHKGFSVEFKQHRAYTPGDEIRRLDWKVFGKTDLDDFLSNAKSAERGFIKYLYIMIFTS